LIGSQLNRRAIQLAYLSAEKLIYVSKQPRTQGRRGSGKKVTSNLKGTWVPDGQRNSNRKHRCRTHKEKGRTDRNLCLHRTPNLAIRIASCHKVIVGRAVLGTGKKQEKQESHLSSHEKPPFVAIKWDEFGHQKQRFGGSGKGPRGGR